MPLLFCVGQHAALETIHRGLNPDENCLHSWMTCTWFPHLREWECCTRELWAHCRIRIHGGEAHVSNQAGQKPEACDKLRRVRWTPQLVCEVRSCPQWSRALRVGHTHWPPWSCLADVVDNPKHRVLLDAIPTVPDVQSVWLLVLLRCMQFVQVTTSEWSDRTWLTTSLNLTDQGLWQCLCTIMDVPEDGDPVTSHCQSAPLSWRVGFEERAVHTEAAYWASWSDTLPMIHARHPVVANLLARHLDGDSWSPSLRVASQAVSWMGSTGSRCHHGRMWQVVCGLQTEILKITNQEDLARVGNMKRQAESSDHRVPLEMLTWIEAPLFVCLCSVVFDSLFLCLNASAGVAFLLTPLAITARHVLGQGCWEEDDLHWKAHCLGSAGKQADRCHKLGPQHGLGRPKSWRQQSSLTVEGAVGCRRGGTRCRFYGAIRPPFGRRCST